MLNKTCTVCGGMLQRGTNDTAVCMKCFRTYRLNAYQPTTLVNPAFQPNPSAEKPMNDETRASVIFLLIVGAILTLCLGLFPLSVGMIVVIVEMSKKKNAKPAVNNSCERGNLPFGEYLKKTPDYIRALRDLPIGTMPLGIYAEKAALQIERMNRKQKGLREMLGADHPFVKSGEDAERYILANCKKVLWRLKYCDQTEPSLCRIHAEYLQTVLNDNEKVLKDYDKLLIEVTQMNDNTPQLVPTLDVLADSLHSIRTGDLPEDTAYQYAGFRPERMPQRQMMR
ncbi:MAG: hypothetical protein IKQ91_11690 [Oscillospiraceae bacterium]|nr:hypothetical protein [Oscillospiraceae bacterium]